MILSGYFWRKIHTGKLIKKRPLILFFAGMLSIVLFFLVPPHAKWGKERLIAYWKDFLKQKGGRTTEQRMKERFEKNYVISRQIADSLKSKGNTKTAWLLLPPTNYFGKKGIKYEVPDPAIFYYYTGLKIIPANSPHAKSANWYARINDGKIIVDSITNASILTDTLTLYRSTDKK